MENNNNDLWLTIKGVDKLPYIYRDDRILVTHALPEVGINDLITGHTPYKLSNPDAMLEEWWVETFDGYLMINGGLAPGQVTDMTLHFVDMRFAQPKSELDGLNEVEAMMMNPMLQGALMNMIPQEDKKIIV